MSDKKTPKNKTRFINAYSVEIKSKTCISIYIYSDDINYRYFTKFSFDLTD